MMCGFKNAYECVEAFSETDLTEDMKKIDIPVLVIHGDKDQVVPIDDSARQSIKLLKQVILFQTVKTRLTENVGTER